MVELLTGDNGVTRDKPSQVVMHVNKTYVTYSFPQTAIHDAILKVGDSEISTTTEVELFYFLLSTVVRDLNETASQ